MGFPTPTFPDLAGKVAFITGGSRGIGAATCRLMVHNGMSVAVCGRTDAHVTQTVRGLEAEGGKAIGLTVDARDLTPALERARERTEAELGAVDVLIASAGGSPWGGGTPETSGWGGLLETSEQGWLDVIDLNLKATFLTLKTFVAGMVERRRGAVVTVSSAIGRVVDRPVSISYAAAKAGVIQLTRHAAKECAGHGVRVNCVSPGPTLSERVMETITDELREQAVSRIPLGRLGTTDDIAAAVLFLASDASSWITGATLDVTGGQVMG